MSKYINNDHILKLQHAATGRDIYGRTITFAEQQAALNAIYKIERDEIADKQLQEQRAEEQRRALELEELEKGKLSAHKEIEHRKLDIEVERVQVEKAQQVVELFRIAASTGMESDKLLTLMQGLTTQLLPGPAPSVLQLEEKKKE